MRMPPTGRQIAEVARRAAEIIQARGKATGVTKDEQGRVCAMGALSTAAIELGYAESPSVQFPPIYVAMRCDVPAPPHASLPQVSFSVSAWSDQPTTTELDIAKLFLRVADAAEVS